MLIKQLNKILYQSNIWILIGLTFPVAGFIALLFFNLYNTGLINSIVSVIIAIIFCTLSIFWWWWALAKIIQFAVIIKTIENKFLDLKNDISIVKKDIQK